jgi:hypothetical protein
MTTVSRIAITILLVAATATGLTFATGAAMTSSPA